MSANYSTRGDSVAARVIDFLHANPDETLSSTEVAAKFGCGRNNVHTLLAPSIGAGMLVRDRDEDGEYIYRATGNKPTLAAVPAKAETPNARPMSSPWGVPKSRRAHFWADTSTIEIISGKEMPPLGIGRKVDWAGLFKRMQVGQCFKAPPGSQSSLSAATAEYRKQTGHVFSRREVDGECFVWRVS